MKYQENIPQSTKIDCCFGKMDLKADDTSRVYMD